MSRKIKHILGKHSKGDKHKPHDTELRAIHDGIIANIQKTFFQNGDELLGNEIKKFHLDGHLDNTVFGRKGAPALQSVTGFDKYLQLKLRRREEGLRYDSLKGFIESNGCAESTPFIKDLASMINSVQRDFGLKTVGYNTVKNKVHKIAVEEARKNIGHFAENHSFIS